MGHFQVHTRTIIGLMLAGAMQVLLLLLHPFNGLFPGQAA